MESVKLKVDSVGTALRLQNIANMVMYVGDDESHLPARSVLLLRRGLHRRPAPHIVPFQSVQLTKIRADVGIRPYICGLY